MAPIHHKATEVKEKNELNVRKALIPIANIKTTLKHYKIFIDQVAFFRINIDPLKMNRFVHVFCILLASHFRSIVVSPNAVLFSISSRARRIDKVSPLEIDVAQPGIVHA